MEVGPLARTLVAYASGDQQVKAAGRQHARPNSSFRPTALFSTLGRVAARALEADIMVGRLSDWVAQLDDNMAHGNVRIHNGEKWNPDSWPKSCQGFGFHEAPRGSLGHWVEIENKKIVNYQAVVPSTWNAGPRDAQGQRGPYEAALLGDADCRSGAATGSPAHRAFLRSMPGLRRSRSSSERPRHTTRGCQ